MRSGCGDRENDGGAWFYRELKKNDREPAVMGLVGETEDNFEKRWPSEDRPTDDDHTVSSFDLFNADKQSKFPIGPVTAAHVL